MQNGVLYGNHYVKSLHRHGKAGNSWISKEIQAARRGNKTARVGCAERFFAKRIVNRE
jgi:hypothetical protein